MPGADLSPLEFKAIKNSLIEKDWVYQRSQRYHYYILVCRLGPREPMGVGGASHWSLKSFSLCINDFKQFIVHTLKMSHKQVPDALSLYTQDTNCLMLMIDALYDGLTDRRLKRRLTKIKKQFTSSTAQSTDSSTDDEPTSNSKFNG